MGKKKDLHGRLCHNFVPMSLSCCSNPYVVFFFSANYCYFFFQSFFKTQLLVFYPRYRSQVRYHSVFFPPNPKKQILPATTVVISVSWLINKENNGSRANKQRRWQGRETAGEVIIILYPFLTIACAFTWPSVAYNGQVCVCVLLSKGTNSQCDSLVSILRRE